MTEVQIFQDLDKLVIQARIFFRKNLGKTQPEIEEIFEVCFKLLKSISKFYTPKEWKDSQQEYSLCILIQAIETILAMYYLAESGYWDNSLTFKRNLAELFSLAIAIGYDKQCYIDWKNGRDNINSYKKITKRIEKSKVIPQIDKKFLPLLKKYWQEGSLSYSHNIDIKSIRTIVKSGQIKFEPKMVKPYFQQQRLRAIRNMLLNVISLLVGIFDYGKVTESRKKEFPEALYLINKCNLFLTNRTWKSQKTQ